MVSLWIDDIRKDPDREYADIGIEPEGWVWVKTAPEAINWLTAHKNEVIDVVSFDHDLGYAYLDSSTAIDGGGQPDDEKFSTSRPVLLWMIENEVWPEEIRVHSHNPVGAAWLHGMADQYAPGTVRLSQRRYSGSAGCTC